MKSQGSTKHVWLNLPAGLVVCKWKALRHIELYRFFVNSDEYNVQFLLFYLMQYSIRHKLCGICRKINVYDEFQSMQMYAVVPAFKVQRLGGHKETI